MGKGELVGFLLWRIGISFAWPDLMAGGMKLRLEGQIYSFTSDLCSGGVFFKNPVRLEKICTHGYFLRRPNGCKADENDVISGQNYACIKYDNRSHSSQPLVQAFIPITAPELPLEHTIAFYDDKDTLKNLRRFAYMKALRGMYSGRETGAVGAFVCNTHNTPKTSIGALCYEGWPDTDGGAFLVDFPRSVIAEGNSVTETGGFFTRKCTPGSIPFPMRRAAHYSFTEGFSREEDFEGEQIATLPELFPEDDANEIGSGEKSNGPSDADPRNEQGSTGAQDPSLSTDDEKSDTVSEGSIGGSGQEQESYSAEEDEAREPSHTSANQPERLDQTEDPAGALGIKGPAFYIDIPTEATTQDGRSGGPETPENSLEGLPSKSFNASSGAGEEGSSDKVPVDLPPDSGGVFVIDFPEESNLSAGVGSTTSSSVDEDLQSGMMFPGGAVGRPEAPVVTPGDSSQQVGAPGPADGATGGAMVSNEIFMHSPMKLKNPQDIVLSKDLTNWDPYIEEAVILAKYTMLRDMKYTKGFDFNTGKVVPDIKPELGLSEQPAAKWFQIIKAAAQVVKCQTSEDLLPSKFIDDAVKLLGYAFRNLEVVEKLQEEKFQGIITSLSKCANSSKKIVAKGVGCPPKFREVYLPTSDGRNESYDLYKLPPASNSFHSHNEDVVVATAWSVIDFVISACYSSFQPDNVNEHHRLYVFMKHTFRHERIQKRWYAVFKGVNAYGGLLPYGNYKILLYNFDKLRAASRVSALYSDYVPKPELMVPDYSGLNILKFSGKPGVSQKGNYTDVASRSMYGDNEEPFIVGQSPLQYKYPFRRGPNKRVEVEWRVKREINPMVQPKERRRQRSPMSNEQSGGNPEWKKYEIWDGLAYCLQANYEIVENEKLKMSGITPSIEELAHLCKT